MMTYKQFSNAVRHILELKTEGSNANVVTDKVVKSNDTVKDGIMIRKEGEQIFPTLYLDDLYSLYTEGKSIEEIAEMILAVYERYEVRDMDSFPDPCDFNGVRNNITFRLLNSSVNGIYMKDVVHSEFLDLSLTYYITAIVGKEKSVMSCKITHELMKIWGITMEELDGLARKNTRSLLGIRLEEVNKIISEMIGSEAIEDKEIIEEALNVKKRYPLYVLTNRAGNSGAVNILYYDVLKKLADQLEDNLYIIPSSIHEVLLIPENGKINKEKVNEMIGEINCNVLRPQDILSDHVYIYDRGKDQVCM